MIQLAASSALTPLLVGLQKWHLSCKNTTFQKLLIFPGDIFGPLSNKGELKIGKFPLAQSCVIVVLFKGLLCCLIITPVLLALISTQDVIMLHDKCSVR